MCYQINLQGIEKYGIISKKLQEWLCMQKGRREVTMSRQDIIDATTNSKRMAQCLKTGDIESAKMLASQQLGANGPLFLEALMSHSVKTPEEIGVLFEKVAKIIEQKKSSMEKRIRNKMFHRDKSL